MKKYYLAIDIGATSGRHILAHYDENNELVYEEVYRFLNKTIKKDGHLFWDVDLLFKNIIDGLKECKKINKIPAFIGIDTFGVDYCLLDENDKLVRDIYSYRDFRTDISKVEFEKEMGIDTLFKKTGVYPHSFNTLYQLYDDKMHGLLKKTKTIMYYPCYLAYLLTGVKNNEISIASTSGMLSSKTRAYDEDILNILGINKDIFAPTIEATNIIGELKKDIQEEVGFNAIVKQVYCHDTASATIGAKTNKDEIFISSGTWSLIGVINNKYTNSLEVFDQGFTNELNSKEEIRFLKNIVGMFIINEIEKEQKERINILTIVEMAKKGTNYKEIFDPTEHKFLAPASMEQTIKEDFIARKIEPPKNLEELFYCVYNSLAHAYKKAVEDIEEITHKKYDTIKVFGGGSKNKFLNQLTEDITKKRVIEGPSEATAIGNIYSLLD